MRVSRFLRSTLPVSTCLILSGIVFLPETATAQSCGVGYRGHGGYGHGYRRGHRGRRHKRLRISRVRGHRHGTHRLHRGYVTSSRIGHTDHPSTWYPSHSPYYRHYSQGSRHGYTVRYGNEFYGYRGGCSSRSYSYDHYSSSYGHRSYGHGHSYGYSDCYSPGYYSPGYYSPGYYSPGYGYRGRYYTRGYRHRGSYGRGYGYGGGVYVLHGHRAYEGPVTQSESWRARMEQAIADGAFEAPSDTGTTGSRPDDEGAGPNEFKIPDESRVKPPADYEEPAAPDRTRKRGRIEYRSKPKSSPSPGSDAAPQRDRSSQLKRLHTLVSRSKKSARPVHKRGRIEYAGAKARVVRSD